MLQARNRSRPRAAGLVAAWLVAVAPAAGWAAEGEPHAGHHMTTADYAALREKVPLYRNYTDEQIDLSMVMMGPNYEVRVGPEEVRGPVGVLLLAHGFGEAGDRVFRERLAEIGAARPTAVAFGMSMMQSSHIQSAVDALERAGATTIVAIPALSSPWNTQMRQWEFAFGLHDDAGYLEVPRIRSQARLHYTATLGDHPLVAGIIADHARERADAPARTLVIIVSHGPTSAQDNRRTLQMLEGLAGQIRAREGYRSVRAVSLQNDAPRDLYRANVAAFRAMVEQGIADGLDVVVVTNLIATRTIQSQIREHLEGLAYRFNPKGLTQHPDFARWVQATVVAELERGAAGG